jgi:hypothetical protein
MCECILMHICLYSHLPPSIFLLSLLSPIVSLSLPAILSPAVIFSLRLFSLLSVLSLRFPRLFYSIFFSFFPSSYLRLMNLSDRTQHRLAALVPHQSGGCQATPPPPLLLPCSRVPCFFCVYLSLFTACSMDSSLSGACACACTVCVCVCVFVYARVCMNVLLTLCLQKRGPALADPNQNERIAVNDKTGRQTHVHHARTGGSPLCAMSVTRGPKRETRSRERRHFIIHSSVKRGTERLHTAAGPHASHWTQTSGAQNGH